MIFSTRFRILCANNIPIFQSILLGGWAYNYTEFSDAEIAEVILYSQALSDTDRKKVEQYLGSKYGIAVSN